ncbi:MAG: hypothetical protein HYZ28_23720 [Myxococcales bacterium]|nr:hypothetical protein [Myxococcales bacterium]
MPARLDKRLPRIRLCVLALVALLGGALLFGEGCAKGPTSILLVARFEVGEENLQLEFRGFQGAKPLFGPELRALPPKGGVARRETLRIVFRDELDLEVPVTFRVRLLVSGVEWAAGEASRKLAPGDNGELVVELGREPPDGGSDGGADGGLRDAGADAGQGDTVSWDAGRVCSASAICWENPLPQGNHLTAIASLGDGTVLVVGNGGVVLRLGKRTFGVVKIGGPEVFESAWASSPTDAVVGGWVPSPGTDKSGLWQFNGQNLNPLYSGSGKIFGVWSAGLGDVWAVGSSGTVVRQKTGWAVMSAGTSDLRAIHGFGSNDIWVVGKNGAVLRWTGGPSFANAGPGGLSTNLEDLWGDKPNDLWVVGGGGTVRRFTGSWSGLDREGALGLQTVWTSGSEAHTAGFVLLPYQSIIDHWSGNGWNRAVSSAELPALSAIRGVGPKDVWAAGTWGALLHWNGQEWQQLSKGATTWWLNDVWVDASGADGWAVGTFGTIFRRTPNGWVPESTGQLAELKGVWATAPQEVWAVGQRVILRRDPAQGWKQETLLGFGVDLNAVWAVPGDVWVAGNQNRLFRRNSIGGDTTFAQVPSTPAQTCDLLGIDGTGSNNVWVVGTGGCIAHWFGGALTYRTNSGTPTAALRAVWAEGPDSVWAVGDQSTILHYSLATDWVPVAPPELPSGVNLKSVHGEPGVSMAIVGEGGFLLVRDGTGPWQRLEAGTSHNLLGVHVYGSNRQLAAVGAGGIVLGR